MEEGVIEVGSLGEGLMAYAENRGYERDLSSCEDHLGKLIDTLLINGKNQEAIL